MIFTEISILPKVIEGDELGIQTLDHSTPKPELLYHYDKYGKTERMLLAHPPSETKQTKKLLSPKEWEKGLGYSWFLSFYS